MVGRTLAVGIEHLPHAADVLDLVVREEPREHVQRGPGELRHRREACDLRSTENKLKAMSTY